MHGLCRAKSTQSSPSRAAGPGAPRLGVMGWVTTFGDTKIARSARPFIKLHHYPHPARQLPLGVRRLLNSSAGASANNARAPDDL